MRRRNGSLVPQEFVILLVPQEYGLMPVKESMVAAASYSGWVWNQGYPIQGVPTAAQIRESNVNTALALFRGGDSSSSPKGGKKPGSPLAGIASKLGKKAAAARASADRAGSPYAREQGAMFCVRPKRYQSVTLTHYSDDGCTQSSQKM